MTLDELVEALAVRRIRVSSNGPDGLRIAAPVGALDEEIRGAIERNKSGLLSLLSQHEASVASRPKAPDAAHRFEPFPLRDIQHAYWIGRTDAFEDGNVGCHIYAEHDCDGLDLERLTAAWQVLVERHDMLRAEVSGNGVQRILESVPAYRIKLTDLRGQSRERVDAELERIRLTNSRRTFVADRWPLFEITATALERGVTRVHIAIDLLIVDGASIVKLLREWGEVYADPAQERPSLTYSFRDYVLGERTAREGPAYRDAREYWAHRLPLPGPPDVPLAESGASGPPEFVRHSFRMNASTWKHLKARAAAHGVTPSALVCSGYADVLGLWSRRSRFTLNVTSFHRLPLHPEVSDILGDFTTTVLLEADNSEAVFEARTRALQRQLHRDLRHAVVSGVQVLRDQRRQAGHECDRLPFVFTSFLGTRGAHDVETAWRWLGRQVGSITQTPQVWLDCQAVEEGGDLIVHLDAVEARFPAALPSDLSRALSRHLERLADDDTAWSEPVRPLLPREHAMPLDANERPVVPGPDALLHELFLEQARVRPEHPAIVSPEITFSYRELAERAVSLAHTLVAGGVGRDHLVAVTMHHGWEQVVAVLAIEIAGAAYLPIEPTIPPERLRVLLEDGGVCVALTQPGLTQTLAWPDSIQVVPVGPSMASANSSQPLPPRNPDDLAYVIYTSGSTGKPKGVMISHAGAVNTIIDIAKRFAIGPDDRVLYLSSLAFDLSVFDVFGTLAAGATIIVPDEETRRDPRKMIDLLRRRRVTVWNSVPALMEMVVEAARTERPQAEMLRIVLLSGDWIRVGLPDQVRELFPAARVVSLGGATEASIWSIWYPTEDLPRGARRVPYGRALDNQTVHVLNERLERCPIWVTGQLYIGGAGIAKGYWRDPERTAERFITHPQTSKRLYATGDLGRYLPDGTIEFLGREDGQVKLRGHRIELGEIEMALMRHPAVANAAVRMIASGSHQELVAYVVPESDPQRVRAERSFADGFWDEVERDAHRKAADTRGIEAFVSFQADVERISSAYLHRALRELGVGKTAGETWSLATFEERHGVQPRHRRLIERWFTALAAQGFIRPTATGWYETTKPLPSTNPEPTDTTIGQEARALLDYLRASGETLVPMLRGEVDPLSLLFPNGSLHVTAALYQDNPLACYINAVAAEVIQTIVRRAGAQRLYVLEIGAGTGATTAALLPYLDADATCYTFTDISRFFLSNAQRKFSGYSFLEYQTLNIDTDFAAQGFAPATFDVVIAANVLHDARDIGETLSAVRTLLAPNGLLLMIEATRSAFWQLITVGFLEGFNAYGDERTCVNGPLLPPQHWNEMLQRAAYSRVGIHPAADSPFGVHVLVAQNADTSQVGAAQTRRIDASDLRSFVTRYLPDYMVPPTFVTIGRIPLTANGKVNREDLPLPPARAARGVGGIPPSTALQRAVAEVWKEVLGLDKVGIDDNFFDVGGDSLLIVQVQSRLAELAGRQLPISELFRCTTIRAISHELDTVSTENPEDTEPTERETKRMAATSRRREMWQRRTREH